MWASRRYEALRRAADMAATAALVRVEARDCRQMAEKHHDDEYLRRSFESSAASMEITAEGYDRTAGEYLAMFGEVDDVRDDDDADGL